MYVLTSFHGFKLYFIVLVCYKDICHLFAPLISVLQPPASIERDGFRFFEKLYLMKMLHTFETQTIARHGLRRVG